VLSRMFSLVKGISVRREIREILKLRTTPLRPVGVNRKVSKPKNKKNK